MNAIRMIDAYPKLEAENKQLRKDLEIMQQKYRRGNSTLGKFAFDLLDENVVVINADRPPYEYRHFVMTSPIRQNNIETITRQDITVELEPVYEQIGCTQLFHGMVGKCQLTGKVFVWYNPDPVCQDTRPWF